MTRKLTATIYDDYDKLRSEVDSDGKMRAPDDPVLASIVAYSYSPVLDGDVLTYDEKVGYIVAVCAVDPVLPGYWLTRDRKVFAKNVMALRADAKAAVS